MQTPFQTADIEESLAHLESLPDRSWDRDLEDEADIDILLAWFDTEEVATRMTEGHHARLDAWVSKL